MSDPFLTTYGVQKCCLATLNLYNVAVDYWLNSMMEHSPDFSIKYHFSDLCMQMTVFFTTLLDTLNKSFT